MTLPYFSVIIPTYNPKKHLLNLLQSIASNQCANDIEVIISDDCSEEPFEEIIDQFSNLDIKVIKNDKHYGFPRNGRENGAAAATGQWLCFADQDDQFLDNSFDKIKTYIEKNNIHNYLACSLIKRIPESETGELIDGTHGWTHGKFYEKAFWDKYQIHYDDVRYCEDTALSVRLGCITTCEGIKINLYNEPIYIWNKTEDSLSANNYFDKSMPDYIKGTIGIIIDFMEKHKDNDNAFNALIFQFIRTIWHIYLYNQSDFLYYDRKIVLESALEVYPIYERFKAITGITTDQLIEYTKTDLRNEYAYVWCDDYQHVPFTEKMTFEQWAKAYLN